MPARLKTKITLGVVFLFALLLLVGGTGFYFLNKSTSEQSNILKENYETLDYAHNMLEALEQRDNNSKRALFEKSLQEQESNITEPGEAFITKQLREHFNTYMAQPDSVSLEAAIRNDISAVMQINLLAIAEKNKLISNRAEKAQFIIALLLTVCALLGLTFVYNFPGYIANPITRLTNGIKAIAAKQYDQRIQLNRNDEFGEMATAFNHMAEELNKYEHSNLAQILFEKQRAETVINSLKDASIGIGKNGTILFANPQALQLLSLAETDIVGKKEKLLQTQNDLFRFLSGDQSNQPFKIVVDGKEQFFSKEMVDISNTEGNIGKMIILKNITPYKELDVAKTNFIATVSHELKTPLASSDFSLKLLEDERVGALNAEQMELVQHLKGDNQRLLKILSELLDFSQVESGKMQLHIRDVDPQLPLQRAVTAVSAAARQKNVLLNIRAATPPVKVKGDEEKMAWVLINFLSNAIKYAIENSIVHIETRQTGSQLEFNVSDTGKGIAPEHSKRIFDRFYQVPGTEKTGTGLGLSISKEFIEAMGGSIGVDSQPGIGSRFYFTLPLA